MQNYFVSTKYLDNFNKTLTFGDFGVNLLRLRINLLRLRVTKPTAFKNYKRKTNFTRIITRHRY